MAGRETGPASEPDWRRLNRANWDERAAVHLGPRGYDLTDLRGGHGRLPIVDDELGSVAGLRILHLQCHIGTDTLALAQRGAEVVGLDFSVSAIEAARGLAAELGLSERVRFVQADLYDAPAAIPEPAAFDRVFVTWGTICWLPDLRGWAKVVAQFLKPGGIFYFAEGHSAALVFDDRTSGASGGRPGFYWPYLGRAELVEADPRDYADPEARLTNATTHQWLHPVGDVVTAVIESGLRLDWLHEHDAVVWRMFDCLVEQDGLFLWPDKPWLPLAYSLRATRPGGTERPVMAYRAMGYDQDFFLWTHEQAAALRAAAQSGANLPIDWENVAEEIESLGRSDRREIASRIGTIIEHLMKLQSSPAIDPQAGWRTTILRERAKIADLLEESPSLRPYLSALIRREMATARRIVAEQPAAYNEQLAGDIDYTEEQVLEDWLP